MRLVRICISATALAVGSLALSSTGAEAATPCPPGQPPGRPPGMPPGPPGPPPGRPPQYPPGQCQLLLSAAAATPRASVTAAGSGYQPGSGVSMRVGSVPVATPAAGGDGRFTQVFTVPADLAPGQYDVQATGTGAGGAPYEQAAILQVLPVQAQQQGAAQPAVLGGLRSGAGLAAGSPGEGGGQTAGAGGLVPGVVAGAGGLTALPGGASAGQAGGGNGLGLGGASSPAVAPGQTVNSGPLQGPGSSGGATPFLALGGGLLLAALGAGAVVAARRRKSDPS